MRIVLLSSFLCICFLKNLISQTGLLGNPPTDKPEIFAPGIVSTPDKEHSPISVSPDGKHIYWSFWEMPSTEDGIIKIGYVAVTNGIWGDRKIAEFNREGGSFYSCFWGNDKIIFRSKDVLNDFWIVERIKNGWGNAKLMGFDKYSSTTKTPYSVSNNGSIYFGDYFSGGAYGIGIYVSRYQKNQHSAPELLPDHINTVHLDWTPCIAPDDSYLLFASNRPGGYGSTDIYITFKIEDGSWSNPINLGRKINTEFEERFPSVSPDGKILFFLRDHDRDNQNYYWIDTGFIEEMRLDEQR